MSWLKDKLNIKDGKKPYRTFETEDEYRNAVAQEVQMEMGDWFKLEVVPNNKEKKEPEKQPDKKDDLPPTKEEVAKDKEKGDD